MSFSKLLLAAAFLPAIVAQQSRSVMPITTDGMRAVTAHAEDGHRLLAVAAEENARTWQFSKHEPMSFRVSYRYRLDADADPNNPTVTLRFPTEVDVSIAPLVISDPPAETKK